MTKSVGHITANEYARLREAEAKVEAVQAILDDITEESAADGYVALADARGDKLGQIRAALSGGDAT